MLGGGLFCYTVWRLEADIFFLIMNVLLAFYSYLCPRDHLLERDIFPTTFPGLPFFGNLPSLPGKWFTSLVFSYSQRTRSGVKSLFVMKNGHLRAHGGGTPVFWMCALSLHRRPLTEFPSSGEVALPRETGEHGGGWCLKGGVVAASTNANPFCSEKIVAVYVCCYHPGPWPPLLPGGGEFRYHRFN